MTRYLAYTVCLITVNQERLFVNKLNMDFIVKKMKDRNVITGALWVILSDPFVFALLLGKGFHYLKWPGELNV